MLRRHVLPTAAPPVVALVGASIGVLVLNVALVEVVFSLDGSFHEMPVGRHAARRARWCRGW